MKFASSSLRAIAFLGSFLLISSAYAEPKADTNTLAQIEQNPSNRTVYKGIVGEIDNIAQQITVRIDSTNYGNGSGVIIARDGNTYYVLTAAHVIKQPDRYQITAPDRQSYSILSEKTTILEGVDLAIVAFVANQTYQVATLADRNLDANPIVFTSGFPGKKHEDSDRDGRLLTGGKIIGSQYVDFAIKDKFSLTNGYELVYTNRSFAGMSGAPILDSRGYVVGINAAAENEIEVERDGSIVEISLGWSLGVPIRTFAKFIDKTTISPAQLKIETSDPPTITDAQQKSIEDQLLKVRVPSSSDREFAWFNYGNQLLRTAKLDEAIAAFDKAIQLDPDFYQAYYARGVILSYRKKYQASLADFERVTQLQPNFYQAWRGIGIVRSLLRKDAEALTAFDRAITIQPDDYILYLWRGDTLKDLQRYDEAIASYNKVLTLQKHPWAYSGLGNAYTDIGEYATAIESYNSALALNPYYTDAYVNRGITHIYLQDFSKAFADLNRAIEIDPTTAYAYYNRGLLFASLQQDQEAMNDYSKAIALAPNATEAYINRGILYASQQDYQLAIADFDNAIVNEPDAADAYFNLGLIYSDLQDYPKALKKLEKAAELFQLQGNREGYRDAQQVIQNIKNGG